MLEGKIPIDMSAGNLIQNNVTERIVYRTVGENKENGDSLE